MPINEIDALLMTINGGSWIYMCAPPEVQNRGLVVDSAQLIGMPPARLQQSGPGDGSLDIDVPRDPRWRVELLPRHAIVWAPDPTAPHSSLRFRDPIKITSNDWYETAAHAGYTIVMIGRAAAPTDLSGAAFVPWLDKTIAESAVIASLRTTLFLP
jgi:hypothetical protein